MSVIFDEVNSTICQHTKLFRGGKIINSIVDYQKGESLLQSMERYSRKLDKLIEKTTIIEQKIFKD
jgi:hypothetical protein